MTAEFELDKTCPVCSSTYTSTSYKNIKGFLYKIFNHDGGTHCKTAVCEIYFKEKYTKKIFVDFQYVDYYVDNILRAFCTDVEVRDLKGIGDIWFPEIDLVGEIKTMKDLDDSIMHEERAIGEILQATDNEDPEKNHEHYIFNVIGSTVVYASTVDDYSTEGFFERVKRIEGFLASIAARFKVENVRTFDNVFLMCIFTVAYAKWLEETKKNPKMYFIERVDIPENEKRTVSMLRAGVPGVDTVIAKNVNDKIGSIENLVLTEYKALDDIPGVGPVKKKEIIDTIKGTATSGKKVRKGHH